VTQWTYCVLRWDPARPWHGGDNLRIEWRWAGGAPVLFQRYAAELVALSPDAILGLAISALARV
jgi:hypothetical protein